MTKREGAEQFWTEGIEAAVSVTFDDARRSQADVGLPILARHRARATFYVSPGAMDPRIDLWRMAVADGQEIGNHTLTHPCSANFRFSPTNRLEDYTLERMQQELAGADDAIEQRLGVRPTTFAYPCGQTFIGRGATRQSYVPLVARRFQAGRKAFDEVANDPLVCDLACLTGMDLDRAPWEKVEAMLQAARREGRWLVLFGHEVGDLSRNQTVGADVLDRLCSYCLDPENRIQFDTVAAIAAYVQQRREAKAPAQA